MSWENDCEMRGNMTAIYDILLHRLKLELGNVYTTILGPVVTFDNIVVFMLHWYTWYFPGIVYLDYFDIYVIKNVVFWLYFFCCILYI